MFLDRLDIVNRFINVFHGNIFLVYKCHINFYGRSKGHGRLWILVSEVSKVIKYDFAKYLCSLNSMFVQRWQWCALGRLRSLKYVNLPYYPTISDQQVWICNIKPQLMTSDC